MPIPCKDCNLLDSCSKKISSKIYNIVGEGRILEISDFVLIISCERYREYILESEENYNSCINFFVLIKTSSGDFCNKIRYKPYGFWKKQIYSTFKKGKING
jgi:hypothetical protein